MLAIPLSRRVFRPTDPALIPAAIAFLFSMLCYVSLLHEAQIGRFNGRAARVV